MKEQRIGRYRVVKHIASGGMADVYMAVMTGPYGFEKTVALKLMHKHLSSDQLFVNMFVDEARINAKLVHPNITQIIDFGEIEGQLYIAMEYVNGVDLSILINTLVRQHIKPLKEIAIYITIQILNAISYTSMLKDDDGHPVNIVHRDITPHNILLSFDGDVKLTDFGIAKARSSIGTTTVGTLKGKIRYMSPEQARGEILDYRSDLYSIALILYELLTHKQAFSGNTDMTLLKHVQASLIDCLPSSINPDISKNLESVVMKALSALPEKRFQTAESFKQALCEYDFDYLSSKTHLSKILKGMNVVNPELNVPNKGYEQAINNKFSSNKEKINIKLYIKWFVAGSVIIYVFFILYTGSIKLFKKQSKQSNQITIKHNAHAGINKDNPTIDNTKNIYKTNTTISNNKPVPRIDKQKKQVVSYSILEINSIPWASVYIADNASTRFIGITPVKNYKIISGKYSIILKSKVYGEKILKMDILPGSKKLIVLRFDPKQKRAEIFTH